MMQKIKYKLLCILFLVGGFLYGNSSDKDIDTVLSEWITETQAVTRKYEVRNYFIIQEIKNIRKDLNSSKTLEEKVNLLIQKDKWEELLQQNKLYELSDISKIRYLKGLQIIKILYEKTLALDHHFASVSTLREINNMSNPNSYPEFAAVKEMLKTKRDKKIGFDLSEILGNNIYTSMVHSFVSLFINENTSKQDKESSLNEIECVLDFTLQMHNDLNTIYFETVFLQKSNENIMEEIQQLFTDFTKPIKYKISLKECRDTDDWDTIRDNLNTYLEQLKNAIAIKDETNKAHTMQINLEFPIDRLLQFITQYNAFIDQGSKFYEKFGIMLGSYENQQKCANKIPVEYAKLKESIGVAIEKFNTAYKPVEINGSKMKEVLYGINEYE